VQECVKRTRQEQEWQQEGGDRATNREDDNREYQKRLEKEERDDKSKTEKKHDGVRKKRVEHRRSGIMPKIGGIGNRAPPPSRTRANKVGYLRKLW
jgi:predicted phage gp36 major capsid-like protein